MQLTNDIIAYAKEMIARPLNKNIYITLTDHINFAIVRYQKGIVFHNALTWEVKRFYPIEFKVGQKAVVWIKERLNIELPEDEATSIALHFVNAQLGGGIPETIDITKFIQSILKIVTYHFQITLNEHSINYERFIIHLKFFAQRIIRKEQNEHDDEELYDMIKNRYSMEYQCAGKIKTYVEKEFSIRLPEEEMLYLTVHIRRIRADKNKTIID